MRSWVRKMPWQIGKLVQTERVRGERREIWKLGEAECVCYVLSYSFLIIITITIINYFLRDYY